MKPLRPMPLRFQGYIFSIGRVIWILHIWDITKIVGPFEKAISMRAYRHLYLEKSKTR